MPKDGPNIVSNSTAATFHNSPQKTGEPVDRLKIYSGKALEFDGVADSLVSDCAAITLGDPFTFSAWINVDNVSGTKLIATNGLTENSRYFIVENNDLALLNYKAGYASDVKIKTSTITLTAGVWHYVVATFDGNSTGALYIDGALELSNVICSTPSASTSGTTNIGRNGRTDAYEHPYAGKMCNFQLWNKAWSADDVTYAYLNPEKLITENSSVTSGITTSDLKLWLPMNDTGITSPQTVVFDAAGTNNTTKAHATTTFLGDELAVNGDFESSIAFANADDSWYDEATDSNQNLTGSADTSDQRNGSQCLKLTLDGSTSGHIAYRRDDYEVGKTYKVSFFMKKATTGNVRIGASTLVRSFSVGDTGSQSITSSYTEFSTTFTATNTSMRVNINISNATDGDVSFMDDFSIKEVGIATGWTDADQQQYIPQTAFMDGCVKNNFDGVDNYISLGNADSLNNIWDGGGSVSAWIFPTALPSGNGTRILCKKQEGHVGWFVALSDLSGSTCDLNFRIDWDGDNYDISTSSRDITLNEWNHIVVVYNSDSTSNTASIFINGSSKTITSDTPTGTRDNDDNKELRIGGQLNSGGSAIIFPFEGIVDEVAIFNKELSANLDLSLGSSEIALLYNSGQPHDLVEYSKTIKSSSNLVSYWKNNNLNSEGKWKDQITTNHGTINGTPDHIFFQQGVTANLCTQGYSNNIVQPSKGSIHFLGQEYAAFPGERIINLDGDFTIEFWFKKTQLYVGSGLIDIMLFGSGTNQIRIPSSVSNGKMISIYYRDGDADRGVNSSFSIHSDNQKSIYEWRHVAIVKESGILKAYIDTATTGNGTLSSTGQMQIKLIGAFSVASGFMYKGFLDDLRVYDKALSAKEITKNYKNGKSQHKN